MAQRREVGLYTRAVGWAKIALPIAAIGLFSLVFLVSETDVFEGTGIVFSKADLSALGEGIQIKSPRFSGVTERGDRFLLTARIANPDSTKPRQINLTEVATTLDLASGESLDLTADAAVLKVPTQDLILNRAVTFATSRGFRGEMRNAQANLRAGSLITDEPVKVQGPMGVIRADALKFETRFVEATKIVQNRLMKFQGGVQLVFYPEPVRQD